MCPLICPSFPFQLPFLYSFLYFPPHFLFLSLSLFFLPSLIFLCFLSFPPLYFICLFLFLPHFQLLFFHSFLYSPSPSVSNSTYHFLFLIPHYFLFPPVIYQQLSWTICIGTRNKRSGFTVCVCVCARKRERSLTKQSSSVQHTCMQTYKASFLQRPSVERRLLL